jgi:hypothetical protein
MNEGVELVVKVARRLIEDVFCAVLLYGEKTKRGVRRIVERDDTIQQAKELESARVSGITRNSVDHSPFTCFQTGIPALKLERARSWRTSRWLAQGGERGVHCVSVDDLLDGGDKLMRRHRLIIPSLRRDQNSPRSRDRLSESGEHRK